MNNIRVCVSINKYFQIHIITNTIRVEFPPFLPAKI